MDDFRWFEYERRMDHDFVDEPVVSIYIGKVHYFFEGRNAWWGVWSQTYPGAEAFKATAESARNAIELRRKRGSQWTLSELPAVVIAGHDDAVIIGEINTTKPLASRAIPIDTPLTLEGLANQLTPYSESSIFRIVCSAQSISPAIFPFTQWKSKSFGREWCLNWIQHPEKQDMKAVAGVVCEISTRLGA